VVERRTERTLRWMLLAAAVLVLVQASIGMVVNLYVAIPARHPGAKPSDYFTGSFHSVVWAVSHGAAALAVHASLGLALALFAIGAAVHAIRAGRRAVATWSVLGGLFVIGAGFNGASFLDFNENFSSLIMALLAFAAICSYAVALFLLGKPPSVQGAGQQRRPGVVADSTN
jgi:heme A synthase